VQQQATKQNEARSAVSSDLPPFILVLALVCGFVALFYVASTADARSEKYQRRDRVDRETTSIMKQRFIIGAAAGPRLAFSTSSAACGSLRLITKCYGATILNQSRIAWRIADQVFSTAPASDASIPLPPTETPQLPTITKID
jgi:hypothetical protein